MAGAYCRYCDFRCFVYRQVIVGGVVVKSGDMATCRDGMAHDRATSGADHTTAHNPAQDGRYCTGPCCANTIPHPRPKEITMPRAQYDCQAPRSSALVRRRVGAIEELDGADFLKMTVTSVIDHNEQLVTTVSRPVLRDAKAQDQIDGLILAVLRKLPGANPGVPITMGREYNVTWDGIRAPV